MEVKAPTVAAEAETLGAGPYAKDNQFTGGGTLSMYHSLSGLWLQVEKRLKIKGECSEEQKNTAFLDTQTFNNTVCNTET